jgi:hypothetical protein
MRALRNIAIIAALAFVVAAVPGGGNAATAVVTTITITFLAVIAWAVYQAYRSQQLSILSLTDAQRALLVAAIGAIVLMIAGADELLDTGAGTLVWLAVLAASIVAIWRLWVQSQTY